MGLEARWDGKSARCVKREGAKGEGTRELRGILHVRKYRGRKGRGDARVERVGILRGAGKGMGAITGSEGEREVYEGAAKERGGLVAEMFCALKLSSTKTHSYQSLCFQSKGK